MCSGHIDGGNLMKIIKRNKAEVDFDQSKITAAVTKAQNSARP